jgi:hypothetical protein
MQSNSPHFLVGSIGSWEATDPTLLDYVRHAIGLDLFVEGGKLKVRTPDVKTFLDWHHRMTDLFPNDAAVMFGHPDESLPRAYPLVRMMGNIWDFLLYCCEDVVQKQNDGEHISLGFPTLAGKRLKRMCNVIEVIRSASA